MNKFIKNPLFTFILGSILFSGVTYAATVLASNVTYDNTSSGINANNVQDAIDSLYFNVNNNNNFSDSLLINGYNSFGVLLSRYSNKYNYFKVSLLDKGSNASCTVYNANVNTKIDNLSFNTDYSTSYDGVSEYRLFLNQTNNVVNGAYCIFTITYHN